MNRIDHLPLANEALARFRQWKITQAEKLLDAPFGSVLESFARANQEILRLCANIGMTYALGKDEEFLKTNAEHRKTVDLFVRESIVPYLECGALAQLVIFSLGGRNSTRTTFNGFLPALKKVERVVFVDDEIAELVLGDEDRTLSFFMAVVSMAASLCKVHKAAARAFGLKKSLLGRLRFKPER